ACVSPIRVPVSASVSHPLGEAIGSPSGMPGKVRGTLRMAASGAFWYQYNVRIRDLLGNGPTFSFEFFPPKTPEAAEQLERTIADLRELKPSFVSVTYGAGGSTREKTIEIVTRIKRDTGIEAMAHLTCAGSPKQELRLVLERIVDSGVENVLALRGDPPKGQTSFVPAEGGFRYAS